MTNFSNLINKVKFPLNFNCISMILGFGFIAFFMGLRFLNIEADSISGLYDIFWTDEEMYTRNARNKIWFGQYILDGASNWSPRVMTPIFHYMAEGLFEIFGVSTAVIRLSSAVLGVVLLTLFSKIFSLLNIRKTLPFILCLLLVSTDYVLFFYSRTGLTEIMLLCFLSLSSIFYLKNTKWSYFLSGVFLSLTLVGKLSTIGVVFAVFIAITGLSILNFKNDKWKVTYFLSGVSIPLVLWGGFFILPNFQMWYQFNLEEVSI